MKKHIKVLLAVALSVLMVFGGLSVLAQSGLTGFRALAPGDMDPARAEHIERVARAALDNGLGVFLEVRADVHEQSGEAFYYVVFTPTAIVGPQGPAGRSGSDGRNGAQGPIGPSGPTGPTGPTGVTGAAGATGPMGPTGPTGAIGPSGIQGIQGEPGPQGEQGIQGIQGEIGPVGPEGPTGPTGADGLPA